MIFNLMLAVTETNCLVSTARRLSIVHIYIYNYICIYIYISFWSANCRGQWICKSYGFFNSEGLHWSPATFSWFFSKALIARLKESTESDGFVHLSRTRLVKLNDVSWHSMKTGTKRLFGFF